MRIGVDLPGGGRFEARSDQLGWSADSLVAMNAELDLCARELKMTRLVFAMHGAADRLAAMSVRGRC